MIRGTGTQTKNVIDDRDPLTGFKLLKAAGFDHCDFSLNSYLLNTNLYKERVNKFFDASVRELKEYFRPLKEAAAESGININQMHMPYPVYVPSAGKEINDYLLYEVAPKSMEICGYLECPAIVVHGLKLRQYLGSESAEWERTEEFLDTLLPMAKDMGVVICIENLYNGVNGHMTDGPGTDADLSAMRIDSINEKYGAEVLGFCYDVGHANLLGIDHRRFINILGKRIRVLHIHDNDGMADLHQLPFTFTKTRENEPSTDWDGFLHGLADIDFDGVLSFETAPVLSSFPEELKKEVLQLISATGRYFIKKTEQYGRR